MTPLVGRAQSGVKYATLEGNVEKPTNLSPLRFAKLRLLQPTAHRNGQLYFLEENIAVSFFPAGSTRGDV